MYPRERPSRPVTVPIFVTKSRFQELPIPICEDFDLKKEVGQITALEVEGDRILALVNAIPPHGTELAMMAHSSETYRGPYFEVPTPRGFQGRIRIVNEFSITGATFTEHKVK